MASNDGKSSWKTFRHRLEAFFCRIFFRLVPLLPYRLLVSLSRVTGTLASLLARKERKVALANLDLVFGDRYHSAQKRVILRTSFQSFARTTMESLLTHKLVREGMEKHFYWEPGSRELLDNLIQRKKGLIALTFHFGNWEWLSQAWGMAGHPITAVAQPIKNPVVEELFMENRKATGHRVIHRRHAARQLYKCLRRGEIIGLLVDLNASIEEGAAFFEFFGLPVLTTRSVGLLALRTGAPIVCSTAIPMPDGRYAIRVGPEIAYAPQPENDEAEIDRITRDWMSHCERVILEDPGQWMWMYKRWKVRPTPDPGRYPYYSFFDPKCAPKLA